MKKTPNSIQFSPKSLQFRGENGNFFKSSLVGCANFFGQSISTSFSSSLCFHNTCHDIKHFKIFLFLVVYLMKIWKFCPFCSKIRAKLSFFGGYLAFFFRHGSTYIHCNRHEAHREAFLLERVLPSLSLDGHREEKVPPLRDDDGVLIALD